MPRSSKWSLSRRSPHQDTAHTSPVSHACHMPRPYHSSWFYNPNNTWWKVQAIKFLVIYIPFVTFMQAKRSMHEHTNSFVAQDFMLNFLFTFHRLYTSALIKNLRLTSMRNSCVLTRDCIKFLCKYHLLKKICVLYIEAKGVLLQRNTRTGI